MCIYVEKMGRTKYRQLTSPSRQLTTTIFKCTLTEQLSTVKYMHKSHLHPSHFQTVKKIVFLIVKKSVFYLNLVTNGNIRHGVFQHTWTILLYRRGDTMQDDYSPF